MDSVKHLLRGINQDLDLPQPIKSRIILVIAADLEDAITAFKNQGLTEKAV